MTVTTERISCLQASGSAGDPTGRRPITRYADGSFTETIAGTGDQPVAGYQYRDENGQWQTPAVPAGGSETVTLAQHKAGDADVPYTIRVSDAAGHLVDVYEPAVDDGRTANETGTQSD